MKYFYQVDNNTVYCVAKYAGRGIVGIAKCNTDYDEFDEEKGKQLAKLRCDVKIAKKRCKRAQLRAIEADKNLIKAQVFAKTRAENYETCKILEEEALTALEKLEHELLIG